MKLAACLLMIVTAIYLVWPSPVFPLLPPGSLQSDEPADTESFYRRSYYTNLTRQEIQDHYYRHFGNWGIKLVHPPEEAQTRITDQARSSWLEEIVHPGRESLYVNAFVPTLPNQQINVGGVHYLNKVTVRYIPSSIVSRLTVLGLVCVMFYFLYREYVVKK